MARRFNPALHPRGARGQFIPKFSQSVRLSPISVSYNAGARVPIVPGRANLYVGALVRVENAQGGKLLKKHTDRAVNSLARRFGDGTGSSHLAQVLKGNNVNVRGLNVQGPKKVINAPTFRVSSTPASRTTHTVQRAPRVRNTRRRHVAGAPTIHGGAGSVRTLQHTNVHSVKANAISGRRAPRRKARRGRAARR